MILPPLLLGWLSDWRGDREGGPIFSEEAANADDFAFSSRFLVATIACGC